MASAKPKSAAVLQKQGSPHQPPAVKFQHMAEAPSTALSCPQAEPCPLGGGAGHLTEAGSSLSHPPLLLNTALSEPTAPGTPGHRALASADKRALSWAF